MGPGEKLTIIVDTETTGLDHRHDDVIELGMVAFIHDAVGAVVDVQRIDLDAAECFIEQADLIIAHNAGFDRPFCEG